MKRRSLSPRESALAKWDSLNSLPDANGSYRGDDTDPQGNQISEVKPGVFEELPFGKKLSTFDLSYPYTEHTKENFRRVASRLNVSCNSLASDLEFGNYSSLRAGGLEERDAWMLLQAFFIAHFAVDVFRGWLETHCSLNC
jgi:capsid protein